MNAILKGYKERKGNEYDFASLGASAMITEIVNFLEAEIGSASPDFDKIDFSGLNTQWISMVEIERSLIEISEKNEVKHKTTWGVIGYYLRGYWQGNPTNNRRLIDGLVSAMHGGRVIGFIPEGPICALSAALNHLSDHSVVEKIKEATRRAVERFPREKYHMYVRNGIKNIMERQ